MRREKVENEAQRAESVQGGLLQKRMRSSHERARKETKKNLVSQGHGKRSFIRERTEPTI